MSTVCGNVTPVCPDCLGEELSAAAGVARCRRCGRGWPRDTVVPCPTPATVILAIETADSVLVCPSHAALLFAAHSEWATRHLTRIDETGATSWGGASRDCHAGKAALPPAGVNATAHVSRRRAAAPPPQTETGPATGRTSQ
jgi:hypothetical protein